MTLYSSAVVVNVTAVMVNVTAVFNDVC